MSAATAISLEKTLADLELRNKAECLSQRNTDLERTVQDLEQSVFMLSHDLREPLGVIRDNAQRLADKFIDGRDAEAALFTANIIHGATRMREMLAELLTYTGLCTRQIASLEAVDMNFVVENVRQNLKALIDETQAVITTDRLPALKARVADVTSLFQNLIANAIHYRSERRPNIQISIQRNSSQAIFAVSDNGPGIDAAYHAYIFEPFHRLHGKDVPGTGLGLAICSRIINRYGGRLWIESKLGAGTTFFFTLPACEDEAAAW